MGGGATPSPPFRQPRASAALPTGRTARGSGAATRMGGARTMARESASGGDEGGGAAGEAGPEGGDGEGRARAFRSLPRGSLGPRIASLAASATGSLRRGWRASLGSPPPGPDAPDEAAGQPVAAPRATGERLGEAQLVLESLRFALAAGEAAYNAELAPLAALAKRCVGWPHPTPAYARRTLASVLEKVKKCSDGALSDMEQMWQKRLTFDGILGVLQKYMDKFDIFITYTSHLHELSSVISGAKIKKSEVEAQAYSNLYDLERVYLPLLHLTVIRKILQQMRGVLEVTNSHLDHFHCKRTLSRITEVLEDCYKVLASSSDASFVSALDKKLNECCDACTRVTFPEVFKKQNVNSTSSIPKSSCVNKENELKQKLTAVASPSSRDLFSTKSRNRVKSPEQQRKSASKGTVLSIKLNSAINVQGGYESGKPETSNVNNGSQALPHRHAFRSESNLTNIVSDIVPKLRTSTQKPNKTSLNSKVASSEKHIIMNAKRISIVDIPLNDNEHFRSNVKENSSKQFSKSEENLFNKPENENVLVRKEDKRKSNEDSSYKEKVSDSKLTNCENQDIYEENATNSDHSGSSRSTLCGGSRHDSSSECTLNEYDLAGNTDCDLAVKESSEKLKNENNERDSEYFGSSSELYFNNELYCSATNELVCCDKKKILVVSDDTTDNNYDYVYVMDSQTSELDCKCATCSMQKRMNHKHSEDDVDDDYNVVLANSHNTSESPNESNMNSDVEDNIYEDVQYVDMNSQGQSEVTTLQDSDCDSNDNYDDIDIYVKPDSVSIRSSSERSRYSSDSGNLEDASHAYYNSLQSVQKSCSPVSSPGNPDDQLDDLHDESDSAIESGSDTGRLHGRRVCRTPSNASLSLQNMVRWKNSQPATPLRPRKALPPLPLETPFEDAPLYQEYYRSPPSKKKAKDDKQSAEEERTYMELEPQEHVYEALDEYLIDYRDMIPLTDTFKRKDKKERTDSRRTQWHETEEVVESGLLDGMTAEQKKLQEAKFEIITSEVSFLKSLNILEKYFINNSEINSKDVLSEEDRRTLFMPIVPVKETSQCFLQDLVKVWEDDICLKNLDLAEVLLKYAKGRFRVYIAYCSRQVDINEVLSQMREKNKRFIEVMEKIEAKSVCQAFTLQSFLTQPMQRITRFPMLVNAIIRYLPKGDESIALWEKVHLTLQAVVTECNEAVRSAEITLAHKKEDKKKAFWTKWVNK
ncbi:Uncharacterized protein GBIM_08114 [Gryllus bimaculatus]|nr:Uncharacterized protein GBIM_08114 [Gryllus bimaculatus]